MTQSPTYDPILIDQAAVLAKPEQYVTFTVDCQKILKSWRRSLYSFEWLDSNGTLKSLTELGEFQAEKRKAVEASVAQGHPIERPILGIGIMENVEIGSGKAEFLTLVAHGVKTMSVHILKVHESNFQTYRVAIE